MNVLQQSRIKNAIQNANAKLNEVVDGENPYYTLESKQKEVEDLLQHAESLCLSEGLTFTPDPNAYAKYQHLCKLASDRKKFKEERNSNISGLSKSDELIYKCNTDILANLYDYQFVKLPILNLQRTLKTLKECEKKCSDNGIVFRLEAEAGKELSSLKEKAAQRENAWKTWLDDEISASNLVGNQTLRFSQDEGFYSIPLEESALFTDMKDKMISSGFLDVKFVYASQHKTLVLRCDAASPADEISRAEFWLTPFEFPVFHAFSVLTFPLFVQAIASLKFGYSFPSSLDEVSDVEMNEELVHFDVGDGRTVDYSWGTFGITAGAKFGFAYSRTQVKLGSPFNRSFMSSNKYPSPNPLYINTSIGPLTLMKLPATLRPYLPCGNSEKSSSGQIREVQSMSGTEFELLTEKLLIAMGFQTETTKKSGDGGIDIIAFNKQPLLSGKYIIQCKRYSGSVGEPVIRDLYGVVNSERANKGVLITSGSFTKQAQAFAADKQLELIDGKKLDALLLQYKLNPISEHSREDGNKEAVFRNAPVGKRNELIESLHDFLFQAVGQLEEKDKMEGGAALVDAKYKAVLTHPTLANELLTEIIACVDFLLREKDNVSADELFYLQRLTGQDDLKPDDVITIAGLFPSGVDSEMLPAFAILALVTSDELNWAIPDFALTIYQFISESTLTLFDIDGEARSASLVANLNRIYSLIDR